MRHEWGVLNHKWSVLTLVDVFHLFHVFRVLHVLHVLQSGTVGFHNLLGSVCVHDMDGCSYLELVV